MAMLGLVFDGKPFPIPKRSLFDLLEHRPELFQATTYAVQSSVPPAIFETFVDSLKRQTKVSVTKGNAASLSLLAAEFFLPELAAECATFSVPADHLASLSDRVCRLELQVSTFSNPPGKLEEEIECHEQALESLRQEIERQGESIDRKVAAIDSRVDELRREFEVLRGEVKDSAVEEIGKLKCETGRVAKSVSNLETLRPQFDALKLALQRLQQDFASVGSAKPGDSSEGYKAPTSPTPTPSPQIPARPSPSPTSVKSQSKVEFPMKVPIGPHALFTPALSDSLDGIISYLTKKHGGHVHDNGIVTITAKSVSDDPQYALKNVAAFPDGGYFASGNALNQWVCWDFREMRVRSTHYTIGADRLKSWVVEGSLDGKSWTEIDRQTESKAFEHNIRASFAVSKPAELRFIRLTQTSKNRYGDHMLCLDAVEFFGTLSE
jgi:hypothetical protein